MKFWLGWILGLAVMLVVLVWGFSQWNLRYYKYNAVNAALAVSPRVDASTTLDIPLA